MTPIIPPIWLYLFEVLDGFDTFCIIITVLGAIVLGIYLVIALICFIEDEEIWKPSKRLTTLLCIILVFSLVTTILIPSRDTMIYMAALSFVTPDNIEHGTEIVKNVFDYVVNALDAKTNTTE